ncbi:MAG: hypothetical protein PHP98_09685 [Kiritimatiellae bacterium]|nr:hypothetical protein [Kiritimatiellia bacterium]
MNFLKNNLRFYNLLAAALVFCGGGTAPAAVAVRDFSGYQVILDKKPFGEVAPSENAQPQAALGDVVARDLEMKSIVDDGYGIRIGLFDKKTNKNFSLGVGESREGLQLVSVDYDNEEAVIKKDSETAVLKLRPSKDSAPDAVPASAPGLMSAVPFQPPGQAASPRRRPFFSDLARRKGSPFQPLGTNAVPFMSRPATSFFKASTGAFPQASFGPFQVRQSGGAPVPFQPIAPGSSNMPSPFIPLAPVAVPSGSADQVVPAESKGATIDRFLQGPAAIPAPPENEMPVEEIAQ